MCGNVDIMWRAFAREYHFTKKGGLEP